MNACVQSLRFDPASETRERLNWLKRTQAGIESDYFKALELRANQRYQQAIATLDGILAVKPDLAKAHAELGTLYALVGDRESATRHLTAVTEYDPDSPSGEAMLGWLKFL